jgi:hypothetical protein
MPPKLLFSYFIIILSNARGLLNEERASLAKTQIEHLKMELAKAQSSSAINWAFVIAAIILGVLIGRSCN